MLACAKFGFVLYLTLEDVLVAGIRIREYVPAGCRHKAYNVWADKHESSAAMLVVSFDCEGLF